MDYNYVPLVVRCDCGYHPPSVYLGVSSLGELCVDWDCPKCEARCRARIPIERLTGMAPPSPPAEFTDEDKQDLKGMHIELDDSPSP